MDGAARAVVDCLVVGGYGAEETGGGGGEAESIIRKIYLLVMSFYVSRANHPGYYAGVGFRASILPFQRVFLELLKRFG